MDDLYDASADFFRPWLDQYLTLSSGLWDGGGGLDEAQERKFAHVTDLAGVRPGGRVLDLGCGLGGTLDYVTSVRKAGSALGVTSSDRQAAHVRGLGLAGVDALEQDFDALHLAPESFDSILSIQALEYLVDSDPEARRCDTGRLRDLFRRAHTWAAPGARFGLEMSVGGPAAVQALSSGTRVPETEEYSLASMPVFLPQLLEAAEPWWEPVSVTLQRDDAVRTYREMSERLKASEGNAVSEIAEGWLGILNLLTGLLQQGLMSVAFVSWKKNPFQE